MPKDWLNLSWKLLLVRGVVALIFGILAMAWPLKTALALALLWGFWALVDGLGSLVQAWEKGTPTRARLLLVVMGVIALIAAFFAITSPAMAAVTLTWILGVWLVVRGAFELVAAFASSVSQARWLLVLGALVDIVLGILFMARPGTGALTIAFVLGLVAFAWGVVFVITAFVVRRAAGRLPSGPDTPSTDAAAA